MEDISDKDLLRAVEELERTGQSGGNGEGYFNFKRTQFRRFPSTRWKFRATSKSDTSQHVKEMQPCSNQCKHKRKNTSLFFIAHPFEVPIDSFVPWIVGNAT